MIALVLSWGAGTALAHPPTTPIPHAGRAWGTYVVCGCCRAGTTARANELTQIVPNSSSLHTLFYTVIYNSVPKPKITVEVTKLRFH